MALLEEVRKDGGTDGEGRPLGADASRIAAHQPAESALRRACQRVAKTAGATGASVFSEDEYGRLIPVLAVSVAGGNAAGASTDELRLQWMRNSPLPLGLLDLARSTGAAQQSLAGPRGLIPPEWSKRCNVAAAMALPLNDSDLLVLERDRPVAFDQADLHALRERAHQLGELAQLARRSREHRAGEVTTAALRRLLETGVTATSPIEAARALAGTAASVLGFSGACAYLVDEDARITQVVTVGVEPGRQEALQAALVGQLATGSPVWRRTVQGAEGADPGPDLIADTSRRGLVRNGGVAQVLGWRSLAAIPLLSSDGPLGLVLCGESAPRISWRAGERELLAQLALEGTVVVDNARLREAERHEAHHDSLTGLLNRGAFAKSLEQVLAAAERQRARAALLVVDLDRFKDVNDNLGHYQGDRLLVMVAERLRSCMRKGDLLARLGGDEFAVLMTTGGNAAGAVTLGKHIKEALSEPFELGDASVDVDASIGAAYYPEHGRDGDILMQRADAAMYSAKRSGLGGISSAGNSLVSPGSGFGVVGELRRALAGDRGLLLHYQTKIDLKRRRVSGVEALVRWEHPTLGMIGPDRFVPLAEETGVVRDLTAWVVPQALRQGKRWHECGLDLRVAVNVSARDVADPELAAKFSRWIDSSGIAGSMVVAEVTEGVVMEDRVRACATLQALRQLGVQVSLDDFGTGYSSLAYLESLPVDEIKLDRHFMGAEHSTRSVVCAVIALGHTIGVRVVAEGVETAEQAAWLSGSGCDEAQGYYFSYPLPAEEMSALLHADQGSVSSG